MYSRQKIGLNEYTPQWRTDLRTMTQRWAAVLANNISDILHDVVFIVGNEKNQKQISCHRLVLTVASPVFQVMFSDAFKTEEKVLTIEVPDLDFVGFHNVITYAYTGSINIQPKDALTTMYAAHKYDIPEIVSHCSELLRANLSIENAITIYQSAVILNDSRLTNDAYQCIIVNFRKLMKTEDFLQCSQKNLSKIIQGDKLRVHSEVDLFNSTLKWAKYQCSNAKKSLTSQNLTEALGDILKHIRFPTMTPKEFATHVEPTGLLNDKDCCVIFKYFSLSGEDRRSVNVPFNILPRYKVVEIKFWTWSTPIRAKTVEIQSRKSYLVSEVVDFRPPIPSLPPPSPLYVNTRCESFKVTSNQHNSLHLKEVSLVGPPPPFNDIEVKVTFVKLESPCLSKKKSANFLQRSKSRAQEVPKTCSNLLIETKVQALPNPGELYQIMFEDPVEIFVEEEFQLRFEYIKGRPVEKELNDHLSLDYSMPVNSVPLDSCVFESKVPLEFDLEIEMCSYGDEPIKTIKVSETPFNIIHSKGNWVVAAMKVILY